MKKPSVRSRCGSVCRYCGMVGCFQTGTSAPRSVDGEVLVSGQEACHDVLVLDGRDRAGRVDEGTAGLQRGRAGVEDLRAGAPRAPRGRPALRQRASGREASVPRSRARRVDQHAVEGPSLERLGRVGGAHVDDRRAHPLRGAAQRVGAAGVASRRRRSRPRCPSARRGGSSCRPGAAHRSSTRSPGCGRERARDGHRGARLRHQQARRATRGDAKVSNGRVEDQRLGSRRRAWRPAGARRAPPRWSSACWRAATASAGSLSAAISARAVSGAERVATTAARSTPGASARSAAWRGGAVGQRVDQRRAPRATARRRTALTSPAPRGRVAPWPARPTRRPRRARGRDRERSAGRPRAAARRAPAASSFVDRPARQRLDHVVERRHALDGAEAELGGEREIARVEPQALRFAVQRAVGPRAPARTRGAPRRTRRRAPARRSYGALASIVRPGLSTCSLYAAPGHLIGSAAAARQGWRYAAPSYRGPNSGLFLKVENGLFAALSPHARTFVQKSPHQDQFVPRGLMDRVQLADTSPWKGMPDMSDTDNTYSMTPRNARPTALGDLRFAGTIAAGLVAGTLGLGALAAPLVGWKDWPAGADAAGDAAQPVRLAKPLTPQNAQRADAAHRSPGARRRHDPDLGRPPRRQRRRPRRPRRLVASASADRRLCASGSAGATTSAARAPRRRPSTVGTAGTGAAVHQAPSRSRTRWPTTTATASRTTTRPSHRLEQTDADRRRGDRRLGPLERDRVPDPLRAPRLADTNGDGVIDGHDDADGDGVTNAAEERNGTDPTERRQQRRRHPRRPRRPQRRRLPGRLPRPGPTPPGRREPPVTVAPPVETPPVEDGTPPAGRGRPAGPGRGADDAARRGPPAHRDARSGARRRRPRPRPRPRPRRAEAPAAPEQTAPVDEAAAGPRPRRRLPAEPTPRRRRRARLPRLRRRKPRRPAPKAEAPGSRLRPPPAPEAPAPEAPAPAPEAPAPGSRGSGRRPGRAPAPAAGRRQPRRRPTAPADPAATPAF